MPGVGRFVLATREYVGWWYGIVQEIPPRFGAAPGKSPERRRHTI
jgi:hypothetical protein